MTVPSHTIRHLLQLVIATSLLPPPATASTWETCSNGGKPKWKSEHLTLHASAVGFPAGSLFTDALLESASAWSNAGTDMSYSIALGEGNVAVGNGENETWWTNSLGSDALCITWWNGACELIEADVIFLNTASYTASWGKADLWPYAGSWRPFQTTVIHEFGHAQGLKHTADTYSVMGQDWDHIHANANLAFAYPGEDAVAGSVAVYGTVPGFEDVALAHWRHTGASGEYSSHDRTRLLGIGGIEPGKVVVDEPVYLVGKGDSLRMEVTCENLGNTVQTVNIGYYLSTNDFISTTDTFLGASPVTIARDTADPTTSPLITIPTWLAGSTNYWLGAIINYDKAAADITSSNNATYVGIRTKADPPDLRATAISGPAAARAGTDVAILRTIDSVGGPFLGAHDYSIHLSGDSVITAADPLVTSGSSTTLGLLAINATLPATMQPGTWFWGLIVNAPPGETSLTDNQVAGNPITVEPALDLVAKSIKGPKKLTTGKKAKVTIAVAVENHPGAATYDIVLSNDTVIGTDDIVVASGSASASGTGKLKFKVNDVAPGTWHWGLIIHPVFEESSTLNNAVLGGTLKLQSN